MLRIKDTQLWRSLAFHLYCRDKLRTIALKATALSEDLKAERSENLRLRTQVEEAKVVFDTMDKKHIADKERMALELERMNEKYAQLHSKNSFEAVNPEARIDIEFNKEFVDVRESVSVLAKPEDAPMKVQEIVNQFPKKKKKNKR